MKQVLIIGCGDVGSALASELSKKGYSVSGVRRSIPKETPVYRLLQLDICKPRALEEALGDSHFDGVIYAVAADERSDRAYYNAYVLGLQHAIACFDRPAVMPQRFIFVSSTGVYQQRGGEWVTEESECVPEHFTGRRVLEGEELLRGSTLNGISVRFGGIYGPGRRRLIEMVQSGTATIVDTTARYTNRIHRDDCAGMLAHLLELPEAEDRYLGVDLEPADASEVNRWLASELSLSEPRTVSWSAEEIHRYGSGKRCSNQRILAAGYRFRFPTYREGYRSLLE
jgi:nucleoside-diphosphate-sugar epimerase